MGLAELAESGQRPRAPAQGDLGGQPAAAGVQAAALCPGRPGGGVRQVGEGRATPQGERLVQEADGLGRVAVLQGPYALVGKALEAVQIDVVGLGAQPPSTETTAVRPMARRSRPTRAWSAPTRSAGPAPAHTSSISASAPITRPGRSARAVSSARRRGPPSATGVPSARWAWVMPRIA
jgi:hypothetical protein